MHSEFTVEDVEKEFLSILVLKPQMAFDLLQIKPNYFSNSKYSAIMKTIIELYEKHKIVDIAQVAVHCKGITITELCEIVDDEYVPITDIKKQFMACQATILENHKKRVIEGLFKKLKNGDLDSASYLEKMAKISEINIKNDTNILTKEEIEENISSEKIRIKLNDFPTLDKMLKLVQQDFVIIGAATGTGKSSLLLNFMNDLMDRYQCIYFNMEMSKSTIYKRMISIKSNVPISYIENPASDYQQGIIKKAINDLEKNQIIIEHKANYLQEIRQVLKVFKNDKHTIIFLDHVGLIKSGNNKSIYEQTTDIAKSLRQLCLDYDCTIIAACQLNRTSYTSNEPNLSMLKDSGELENSSSKVILLYRDKTSSSDSLNPVMILDIVKNRDGQYGKVFCKYDKSKQIFKEEVVYA